MLTWCYDSDMNKRSSCTTCADKGRSTTLGYSNSDELDCCLDNDFTLFISGVKSRSICCRTLSRTQRGRFCWPSWWPSCCRSYCWWLRWRWLRWCWLRWCWLRRRWWLRYNCWWLFGGRSSSISRTDSCLYWDGTHCACTRVKGPMHSRWIINGAMLPRPVDTVVEVLA